MIGFLRNHMARGGLMNALILAASLAALGAALTAEYGFGLKPCVLCIYQRIPYMVTALLGVAGLVLTLRGSAKPAALMLFLSALVFLGGAAIAFYHAGVEQHWWLSAFEGCKLDFSKSDDLLAQIEAAPVARCDEIPWADPVIGLSMAAWNGIMSFGLFLLALVSSILAVRKANGF